MRLVELEEWETGPVGALASDKASRDLIELIRNTWMDLGLVLLTPSNHIALGGLAPLPAKFENAGKL
ncbi:hypothetical protein ACJ72_07341 [Emergomyces africanus]|uniref:Uncharacterized protein n=1 Tax=Emergomyces africanus TaxID=1955775 RepID=A0A1B7NNF4_9EURO|nr:hypothetical protein ACJ72_07341 [Emergomyces africanus]